MCDWYEYVNIWANYEYCFFYALPNRYSTQSLEKWKRRRQLLIFSCLFKKLNCRIYTHMDLRSSGRFFSFAICSHLSLLVGQGHRLKQGQSWKEIVTKEKEHFNGTREKEKHFCWYFWAGLRLRPEMTEQNISWRQTLSHANILPVKPKVWNLCRCVFSKSTLAFVNSFSGQVMHVDVGWNPSGAVKGET